MKNIQLQGQEKFTDARLTSIYSRRSLVRQQTQDLWLMDGIDMGKRLNDLIKIFKEHSDTSLGLDVYTFLSRMDLILQNYYTESQLFDLRHEIDVETLKEGVKAPETPSSDLNNIKNDIDMPVEDNYNAIKETVKKPDKIFSYVCKEHGINEQSTDGKEIRRIRIRDQGVHYREKKRAIKTAPVAQVASDPGVPNKN